MIYKGISKTHDVVVLYEGKKINLNTCLNLQRYSPDGFCWGYSGSGPSQLALAILNHHLKNSPNELVEKLKNVLRYSDYSLEDNPPSMEVITWRDWISLQLHQDYRNKVIARIDMNSDFEISSEDVSAYFHRILNEYAFKQIIR